MNENKLREIQPLWNSWYIDRPIGEGSFGSVYRIVREEFGIKYYSALKVISIPKNQNEIKQVYFEGMNNESASHYFREVVEDIYKEIVLMSHLKGKTNIVSYEDHQILERKDGIGYDILIRMELLQGLNDYATNNIFSNAEVVKMGKDICNALILCQKQNIMHRDIKPDNIFVSRDGDYKLGDFGIAKKVEKTDVGMSIKGSYEYMAPEVYLGKDYDARVDIYSLGIVLYTFLNNRKIPFLPTESNIVRHGERQEALRKRFKGFDIPMPILTSDALGKVILKSIEFEPDKRYCTAEEFLLALSKLKDEDLETNSTYLLNNNLLENNQNNYTRQDNVSTVFLDDMDKTVILKESNTVILKETNSEIEDFDKTVLLEDINEAELKFIKDRNEPEEKGGFSNLIFGILLFLLLTIGILGFVILKLNDTSIIDNTDSSMIEDKNLSNTKKVKINLSGKKLVKLENIKNLDQVTELDVSNNQLKDISILSKSVNLESLDIQENQIVDISAVTNMEKLFYLSCENNKIKDISSLAALKELTNLSLADNEIKDITALSSLSNLTILHLENNSITNIESIKKMSKLTYLNISGNKITDFEALYKLKKLKSLVIKDVPVSKNKLNDLQEKLPNCQIKR